MNKKILLEENTLLVVLFLHVLLVPNRISFILWFMSICWYLVLLLCIPFISNKLDKFKFKKEFNNSFFVIISLFLGLIITLGINIFFVVFDYVLIQKIFLYIFLSLITVYITHINNSSLHYSHIIKIFSYMVLVLGGIRYVTHEFLSFLVHKNILDFSSWTFWQDVEGRLLILILFVVLLKNILVLIHCRLIKRF